MSEYVLSVVIPTKDRIQYLAPTIEAIVGFRDPRIEIVIEDNSKDPQACEDLLARLAWPHVRLNHSDELRSQTANSESAIARAQGSYVCFIGDDDCITPSLVTACELMQRAGIECANFGRSRYFWADVVFKGKRYPDLSMATEYEPPVMTSSAAALESCLERGASSIKMLPRVYHGVVSRALLERIRIDTGSVFPGPSPDMAAAVALACHSGQFLEWEAPLIVDGISYHSAGGRGARGEHKARLSDVDQLPEDVEDAWDPRVPKVWLGPTIWAQSCISALVAVSRSDLVHRINWAALYAHVLVFHPDCRPYVLDARRASEEPLHKVAFSAVNVLLWRGGQFLRNRFRTGRRSSVKSASCASIIEAVAQTDALACRALAGVSFEGLSEHAR